MGDIFRRTLNEREEAAGTVAAPEPAASVPALGTQTKFAGTRIETDADKKRKALALAAMLRKQSQ